jgi:uncharacterized iron-regulated membrane protein
MASIKTIRRWFWWHRWSSLICTIFLVVICLTGLPLIFSEEIESWVNPRHYPEVPAGTKAANLDTIIDAARLRYPRQQILSIFVDNDEPQAVVSMAQTMKFDDKTKHALTFDSRTGKLLKDDPPFGQQPKTFMEVMLDLHTDLFAGLPGELFLGLMGMLFVISTVSGIVLYGPFMKKLDFGTIRKSRGRRLKWLDLHNLLGIATAVWLLVVGLTGVMNELSKPLFGLWQITDVKTLLDKYKGQHTPPQEQLGSVQDAYTAVQKELPGMAVVSVVYPGNTFGSPYHYLLWAKGNQPFSSRLFTPTLVNSRNGKIEAVVKMPFYLRALEVSRPLHFGDYGGTPLKVIWALFDIAAITVLCSGVYLWIKRRKFYRD